MKKLLTAVAILLTLSACEYTNEWRAVPFEKDYQINVPSWLEETDELRPGAPFQFHNRFRNVYVIAFSDKKEKDFAAYQQDAVAVLQQALTKPLIADSVQVVLAGDTGLRMDVFGKMDKDEVFYSHITLDAGDKYIQLCAWTRGEGRKLKQQPVMDSILYSFRRK